MKKYLFMIAALLFLVGCSEGSNNIEIHENVYENLGKDSLQVMDRLEELISSGEKPSEEDETLFSAYRESYEYRVNEGTLSESINEEIYDIVAHSIENLESNLSLSSGEDQIKERKEMVQNYIKDGMTALDKIKNDEDTSN